MNHSLSFIGIGEAILLGLLVFAAMYFCAECLIEECRRP